MEKKALKITSVVVYEFVATAALLGAGCAYPTNETCASDAKHCHEEQHTHSEAPTSGNMSTTQYGIALVSSGPPMPNGMSPGVRGQLSGLAWKPDQTVAYHAAIRSMSTFRNVALLETLTTSTSSAAAST